MLTELFFLFISLYCCANVKGKIDSKVMLRGIGKPASGIPLKEGTQNGLENLPK